MQEVSNEIDRFVDRLVIPPVPDVLLELHSIIQSDDLELASVSQVIQKDVGISSLVLKIINSPAFARRVDITSIPTAVSLLGVPCTMNIVTGVLMRETFDTPSKSPPRFQSSSSNIAQVTAGLTRRLLNGSEDEGYLLGLFHNVGHALIHRNVDGYDSFFSDHQNHPEFPITHFEDEFYSYDHAQLGYLVSKEWGLPKYMRDVIFNHHNVIEHLDHGTYTDEQDRMKGLLAVLKMAEYIEEYHSTSVENEEWLRIGPSVLGYLGLSDTDFEDICHDKFEKLDSEFS